MRSRLTPTRLLTLSAALVLAACSRPERPAAAHEYPITAVPLTDVTVTDGFWATRMETNRAVTIPHIMRENVETGRVANLEKAAGLREGPYEGRRFNDTDVYKAIEAASYSLKAHPFPALDRQLDELIALIARAQQPDGYLYPARTIDPGHPALAPDPSAGCTSTAATSSSTSVISTRPQWRISRPPASGPCSPRWRRITRMRVRSTGCGPTWPRSGCT